MPELKNTDSNEIRTLIGLLILQSICPKPEYKMYFSRRESSETPFFSKVIGGRRLHLLLKFLHFVDNSTILTSFNESLIGWKGRLAWKRFIPSKRKQFGIKMFALCESYSGYMYNYLVYTSADTEYKALYINEPFISRVVLTLIHPLLDKEYRIIDLCDQLVKRRTDSVGTMRINRKGIRRELKAKLQRGETVARFRGKLMIQKRRDKKDVLMISTVHDDSMKKIAARCGDIEKLSYVIHYNASMGGVDLSDNYLNFYGIARTRVKKFYIKMFFYFLSVTTLNAFQIYKKNGGKLKRLNFLLELGEKIVKKYSKPLQD
ncbi:unnamed protein product [Acanthoscelides obtectus]|uniref:PiggyBac transposable element-derived protein domain-containing protein n=1 Tax=Acanthoscelides obtectus TaxID=200917 RepID=A0A9P0M3X4_ACAOB|nr:unnamed protein product [Acanthoscelides obtectus]CAK1638572.1 PiggyBac transposable element-derived protein 4 [Acanthoscelides obtectus]